MEQGHSTPDGVGHDLRIDLVETIKAPAGRNVYRKTESPQPKTPTGRQVLKP